MEPLSCEITWTAALLWFGMGAAAVAVVCLVVLFGFVIGEAARPLAYVCDECGRPFAESMTAGEIIMYHDGKPARCNACTKRLQDMGILP